MLNRQGFTKESQWYKGNLHCHTTQSDGMLTPAEAVNLYREKGNFYSSTGPKIYGWGIRDGIAYVDCSPCEQINFICGGAVGVGAAVIKGQMGCRTEQERRQKRELIEHGEYTLKGTETYVRVEFIDENGKTAWSNAIF